MPSVELVRLRQQAVELAEFFPQPQAFARKLDLLLESYSAAPSRKGDIKGARAVLPSYGAPAMVLKQIYLECQPLATSEPALALDVVDQLWSRRVLEPRQLAVRLLGAVPPEPVEPVAERLEQWNAANRELSLLIELGQEGTQALRERRPQALLALIAEWFASDNWREAALGLIALESLLSRTDFPDLPSVFKLLAAFPPDPPDRLRPYWVDTYRALIVQSPKETLYYLQQRLSAEPESGFPWLARQLLDDFSPDQQAALKADL